MTALKAVSTVTLKVSERTVRASTEAMRKPSSEIRPRISGSTQNSVGSPALSAIGLCSGVGQQQHFGRDFGNG